MFKSKYPIVCVSMNQVSDLNLALAVAKAGAVPSININIYRENNIINYTKANADLDTFLLEIGNLNLIYAIKPYDLLDPNCVSLLKRVSHCELVFIPGENVYSMIRELKTHGCKILLKMTGYPFDTTTRAGEESFAKELYDGFIIKGPDSAGRINTNIKNIEKMVLTYKKILPDHFLIPCGGIGTASKVKLLMSLGSDAIGIGTLFAASLESSVSIETKQKMIESKSSYITKLSSDNLPQNSLKFTNWTEADDANNTESLKAGIKNSTIGHIFVGKSIDYINEIKSVNDIVQNLITEL